MATNTYIHLYTHAFMYTHTHPTYLGDEDGLDDEGDLVDEGDGAGDVVQHLHVAHLVVVIVIGVIGVKDLLVVIDYEGLGRGGEGREGVCV